MADPGDPKFALFQLYLATAEKVSDRRAQANSWMLSVNSAIVGLYGCLQAVGTAQKAIWLWAIPAAGVIVCAAWAALLASYRDLNRAKFTVLAQLEAELPVPPFTREREIYKSDKRTSFSQIERWIPGCFILLYATMLATAILR
jgi:hypothetical protein